MSSLTNYNIFRHFFTSQLRPSPPSSTSILSGGGRCRACDRQEFFPENKTKPFYTHTLSPLSKKPDVCHRLKMTFKRPHAQECTGISVEQETTCSPPSPTDVTVINLASVPWHQSWRKDKKKEKLTQQDLKITTDTT